MKVYTHSMTGNWGSTGVLIITAPDSRSADKIAKNWLGDSPLLEEGFELDGRKLLKGVAASGSARVLDYWTFVE